MLPLPCVCACIGYKHISVICDCLDTQFFLAACRRYVSNFSIFILNPYIKWAVLSIWFSISVPVVPVPGFKVGVELLASHIRDGVVQDFHLDGHKMLHNLKMLLCGDMSYFYLLLG